MFGAIFGGALAGQLSDRLGRRKMILISALIFVVGSILSGIAPHNGQYYLIGVRILLGLAVGAASASSRLTCRKWHRLICAAASRASTRR